MTSVVVPVFNGAHVLGACAPATLALRGVDEWIWVDDGSTDGTAAALDGLLAAHPTARLVRHDANRGRSAARNTGVAHAHGDVLVFLDADVAPEPDLAERFARVLSGGATATVARFALSNVADDAYGEYLRRARRGVSPDARVGDVLPWRLFLAGASAVQRSAFDAAGGFDVHVAYGEDLALACRLSALAPAGLQASGATAHLTDPSSLEQTLANLTLVGRALPELQVRCPGVLRVAGLERVLGPGVWHALAASPLLGRLVAALAPVLPKPVQPVAVRYLLGHTLVRAYDDARLSPRPGR